MFSTMIEVLEIIVEDGSDLEQKADPCVLLDSMLSLDFAFNLDMMKNILRITNELSKTLQCKELDIENAMTLVKIYKQRLQIIIDDEYDSFLNEVASLFTKHEFIISNMNDKFVAQR